ncbi:MAG: tryptophan synthase subunit alpha [Candidatus Bathyarchaeota archaeon]|nr:tryptophan synthase subunit alpha [Candidatus Bathyarchaeota archaeon]
MNAIKAVFQKAKTQNSGVLIGYIMAGDPTPEATPKIADALIAGGVDILELGLPFSDPIADGPTIQAASVRALNAGTIPPKVLEIAKQIKTKHDVPVVIMTYYNPVFKMGLETFFAKAKEYSVNGVIVPDLPVEEAYEYKQTADKYGIDTIFLATPATNEHRLAKIVDASSGFLYLVSRYGVTGEKTSLADSTVQLIQRVSTVTTGKVALAVGFGISKPEHVKQVIKAGADAAIVGSTFVNIIQKYNADPENALKELEKTAYGLKEATKKET